MRRLQGVKNTLTSFFSYILTMFLPVYAQNRREVQVDPEALGFAIPTLGDVLTFIIRLFFVIAGVFALIYLLIGAFRWVTSGGNKENVEKARDQIQNALVGVILIIVVVAIVATLEQVAFRESLCFGLTCPLTLPVLLRPR